MEPRQMLKLYSVVCISVCQDSGRQLKTAARKLSLEDAQTTLAQKNSTNNQQGDSFKFKSSF